MAISDQRLKEKDKLELMDVDKLFNLEQFDCETLRSSYCRKYLESQDIERVDSDWEKLGRRKEYKTW